MLISLTQAERMERLLRSCPNQYDQRYRGDEPGTFRLRAFMHDLDCWQWEVCRLFGLTHGDKRVMQPVPKRLSWWRRLRLKWLLRQQLRGGR